MARAPFNVLVVPYRNRGSVHDFAVFHRADCGMWQFIAGGGEDTEQPIEAARREAFEEAGIDGEREWLALDARASIPRSAFPDSAWPPDVVEIPEICFGVHVSDRDLRLSREHDRFEWLDYASARTRLTWDSNRVALWELRQRLDRGGLRARLR